MEDEQKEKLVRLGQATEKAPAEAGLNKAEAARRSGVNKSTLGRWGRGGEQPRNKAFQDFFDAVKESLVPVTRRELFEAAVAAGIKLRDSPEQRRTEPRTPPTSHGGLGIGSTPRTARSPEERAEEFNRQERWAEATPSWLLAADTLKRRGDGPGWERCKIAAAQMYLNLGQLKRSKHAFLEVLRRPAAELTPHAEAEANIRLGRLYYEQDRFAAAKDVLEKGVGIARTPASTPVKEFRVLDNGTTVVCDGHEAMVILEKLGLDYLGRIDIVNAAAKKGLNELEDACQYPRSKEQRWNLGCRLIEKIPGLLLTNDADNEIEKVLSESCELLHAGLCGEGLYQLARARWLRASEAGNPMTALEAAHEGFTKRTFAPLGVADVDLELSDLFLPAAVTHRQALQYAVAATAFRPYGRALTTLVNAASAMFSDYDYDVQKFSQLWRDVEERLAAMQDVPFIDLGPLSDRLGYEPFKEHFTGALRTARQTVEQGVLARPGVLSG